MKTFSYSTSHIVEAGTRYIESLAFRKCRSLTSVTLPEGLQTIGDAAFSYCSSLQEIEIPASVERIGVAAFCKSGLVSIQFFGIPKVIESDVFEGCVKLKEIVVPNGGRDVFVSKFGFPKEKVVEGLEHAQVMNLITDTHSDTTPVNLFNQRKAQLMRLSYNGRYFYWSVGDEVNLKDVFSGPISLVGSVTYEFRRKALFIFVKSVIARTMKLAVEYELSANVDSFKRKYQEKYAYRVPRIFVFVSDDGKTAKLLDEVQLVRMNTGTIMVRSVLNIK